MARIPQSTLGLVEELEAAIENGDTARARELASGLHPMTARGLARLLHERDVRRHTHVDDADAVLVFDRFDRARLASCSRPPQRPVASPPT